ncbi:MAG TPA: amidohydrolase family protein [Rectinemataceae bacterium]|nr:amidohydrolase family protein [Rectinemataceae bacterium]
MIGSDFSSETEALDFLDFSVSFGRPPVPFTGAWVDKAGLRAEMKRVGVRQAAPYHILSKSYDADYGNKLILEELKDAPELIPTWAAVPSEEGMGCSPRAFADMFEKSGAKVVRLFPSSTGNPAIATRYAFAKWFYGDYLEELQKRQIPIVLEFSPGRRDEPAWDKLCGVAGEFPTLPIVLSDGFQRTTWSLIKMMRAFPNLYVQTSGLDVHRQLEYMVQQVGPRRFIAGSKFPVSTMGTMVGQVLFSNLPIEQKRLIAGGNARRLMKIASLKGEC